MRTGWNGALFMLLIGSISRDCEGSFVSAEMLCVHVVVFRCCAVIVGQGELVGGMLIFVEFIIVGCCCCFCAFLGCLKVFRSLLPWRGAEMLSLSRGEVYDTFFVPNSKFPIVC